MAVYTQSYSMEAFERIAALPENRDHLLELVNGGIVEKIPSPLHSYIVALFVTYLNLFVMEHQLGIVVTEARHHIGEKDVRLPDVAFIAGQSLPLPEKSFPAAPDLVIEVKSPDDTFTAMREKADFYLKNGTQMVWLVYPEKRLIEVYRAGADIGFLTIEDTLDGGDVLPGFTLPVAKIFPA